MEITVKPVDKQTNQGGNDSLNKMIDVEQLDK